MLSNNQMMYVTRYKWQMTKTLRDIDWPCWGYKVHDLTSQTLTDMNCSSPQSARKMKSLNLRNYYLKYSIQILPNEIEESLACVLTNAKVETCVRQKEPTGAQLKTDMLRADIKTCVQTKLDRGHEQYSTDCIAHTHIVHLSLVHTIHCYRVHSSTKGL